MMGILCFYEKFGSSVFLLSVVVLYGVNSVFGFLLLFSQLFCKF